MPAMDVGLLLPLALAVVDPIITLLAVGLYINSATTQHQFLPGLSPVPLVFAVGPTISSYFLQWSMQLSE